MEQTKKKYDYDSVMELCNTGNALDQYLTDYQNTLLKLEETIRRCEKLFHGKGSNSWQSVIYGNYEQLFFYLGNEDKGAWSIAKDAHILQCLMYTNAKYDKEHDQQ